MDNNLEKVRKVLLNPGPVTSTDGIRNALLCDDICPKEQEFIDLMLQLRQKLCKVVNADFNDYDAVLFCSSGTLILESVIASMVDENKKVLMVENGTYAKKAMNIPKAYNLGIVHHEVDILEPVKPQDIERLLIENPDVSLVYVTHQETGTGLLNPIRKIGEVCHKHGVMLAVDAISTYGLIPIDMEKDHVDFVMSGAQKGLYAMTGISFVIGKRKLIEASESYPMRTFYAHLYSQYHILNKTGDMRFTPPVQLVYAAVVAVDELLEEGVIERSQRTRRVWDRIREHGQRLGFRETLDPDKSAKLVVAFDYPDGIDFNFKHFHDFLFDHHYTIFPFQTGKPNTFRVGAIGAIDENDIDNFFELVEKYWHQQGYQFPVAYK